ncbi:MAG TPA: succinate dehydrogenase, cytochrome b556 subunit [Caulobacteraceae bacterium]|nr:succinate dehydrogenase, cytochrome b556 subunit [Caulobacteraceae bacterium]
MSQSNAGVSPKARNSVAKPLVRPLSPHLQIWRFHTTMLGSILSRAAGIGLYVGAIIVVAWIATLTIGGEAYESFLAVAGSPVGLLVWFLLTAGAFYHLAAGIRHLIWDLGYGLSPRTATTLTNLTLWFGVLATIGFWVALFATGKVQL